MTKSRYCLWASAVLIAAGIGFGVAGFCVSPVGEVSDSVLILIAQCFLMAGSFVGVDALLRDFMHRFRGKQTI